MSEGELGEFGLVKIADGIYQHRGVGKDFVLSEGISRYQLIHVIYDTGKDVGWKSCCKYVKGLFY